MIRNLDLEELNVHEIETTRKEVRDYFDDDNGFLEKVNTALDGAQGAVPEKGTQYVVIKITA